MIFLNSKFEFDDITLLQGVDNNEFSILKNKFSDAYSKCDKLDFAKGIKGDSEGYSNIDFVDGMTEEQALTYDNVILATYYFKKLFI